MKTFAAAFAFVAAATQFAQAGVPQQPVDTVARPAVAADAAPQAKAAPAMIVAGRYGETSTKGTAINDSSRGRWGGS